MTDVLAVVLNGTLELEYHRTRELPTPQREYLQQMDQRMDAGISLGGVVIATPNQLERAQFVATSLVHALSANNEPVAAASCAYLANRIPALRQIKATEHNTQWHVDLVFDKDYVPEQTIKFVNPDTLKPRH